MEGRPRRHTRSRAVLSASSDLRGAPSPIIEASAISHASRLAGFDPLSAEPDQVFARLSVKDAEAFENAVREAHRESQAALRSLVSTQYPDMLGTASSVIDMSRSAGSLVQHVEAVYDAVQKEGSLRTTSQKTSTINDEERRILGLAATTKLLDELPMLIRGFLRNKPLTLHAAWACRIADPTLEKLSSEPLLSAKSKAKELAALKEETTDAVRQQLASPVASYNGLLSHTLAHMLLQGGQAVEYVLDRRKEAVAVIVALAGGSRHLATSSLLQVHRETVSFVLHAFLGNQDALNVCRSYSGQETGSDGKLPPHAKIDARSLLDRTTDQSTIKSFLPDYIRTFRPEINIKADGDALSKVEAWSKEVLEGFWKDSDSSSLAAVDDVSEFATSIFTSISASKQWLQKRIDSQAALFMLAAQLDSFRAAALRLLDERLVGIYREKLDEIAATFEAECRLTPPLPELGEASAADATSAWLLGLLAPSSFSSVASPATTHAHLSTELEQRLQTQTPELHRILSRVEGQASDVGEEMKRFWSDAEARDGQQPAHLEKLRKQFAESVQGLFDKLESALRQIQTEGLLLSHVAAGIATSWQLGRLAHAATGDAGTLHARFLQVANESARPWIEAHATEAAAGVEEDSDGAQEPSPSLVSALSQLASCARQAGPRLALKKPLLDAFQKQLMLHPSGSKGARALGAADQALLASCQGAGERPPWLDAFWTRHALLLDCFVPPSVQVINAANLQAQPDHTSAVAVDRLAEPKSARFKRIRP